MSGGRQKRVRCSDCEAREKEKQAIYLYSVNEIPFTTGFNKGQQTLGWRRWKRVNPSRLIGGNHRKSHQFEVNIALAAAGAM